MLGNSKSKISFTVRALDKSSAEHSHGGGRARGGRVRALEERGAPAQQEGPAENLVIEK